LNSTSAQLSYTVPPFTLVQNTGQKTN